MLNNAMTEPSMPTTVQLFGTCLVEALRPEAGLAIVQVLERLGVTVEYPEGQICCGQPAFNAGCWADAPVLPFSDARRTHLHLPCHCVGSHSRERQVF